MSIPQDLLYTKSHEWVRNEGDGTVTLGITNFAQEQLGDIVYWEAPEEGDRLDVGDTIGTVESVKAVSDVFAALAGVVVRNNENLVDQPELINAEPYGLGWMIVIRLEDPDALSGLMDAAAYEELLGTQETH